jgi:Putative peptidoglycan binding domain
LDLALARIKDNLGQLRGPVQRSAQQTLRRRIAGRVKVAHLRYALGAVLSLALVGIAVNALLLQRERHPAPLFGRSAPEPPSAASAPPPPPAPRLKPAAAEYDVPAAQSPAALPPERPAETARTAPPASDPIAELLAAESHDDSSTSHSTSQASHLTLAAQTALAKLGYSVKPDGKEGAATEQALRDFEHAHALPPATEITERLVKQLTQAARAAEH